MGLAYVRHASRDRLKSCNSILMFLEDMVKKRAYRQSARGDGTVKREAKCTTDWRRESGEHLMFRLHVSILSGRLRVSNALVGESWADH